MARSVLDSGSIPFETEGRLLHELGLRLVASPEVALVELIKNAYDADAISCEVSLANRGSTLIIKDSGHGMTADDFKSKWMRIATATKVGEQLSPKFKRKLTGAKGIGRFAVRYLGDHLTLESVAVDPSRRCKTKLKVDFDWPKLDSKRNIQDAKVDYEVVRISDDIPTGTTLIVNQLRTSTDFTHESALRTNILRIASPFQGLDKGPMGTQADASREDPGFKIVLPGNEQDGSEQVDLSKMVLDNYWAKLTIELKKNSVNFSVHFAGASKPKTLSHDLKSTISKGFFADIRFFPRRKGVFHGKGINGIAAWEWVRENCGVAVIDHGFRIMPYGIGDNDWLNLDIDNAHNKRDWGTDIAKEHFPIPANIRNIPSLTPALSLPSNFQLVGAVFVESKPSSNSHSQDLIPSMDREGFLKNESFAQLQNCVRAGIEFLANEDKKDSNKRSEKAAKLIAASAREDIRNAISYIESSPSLTPSDKARIVKQYQGIAEKLDEQETYSEQSRRSLMTMSMLGVIAGFMTHESKAALHALQNAAEELRVLSKKNPSFKKVAEEISKNLENFKGYLNYAQMFLKNVRGLEERPLPSAGQVRQVTGRFKTFVEERGISVKNDIAADVLTPPLPVTVYSGILLNLFTNAIKGILAAEASVRNPTILFRAWNEKKSHIVEVSDNGIGVPPNLRKRIWDPLYTTTSDENNPLGSGMGLGLSLVKQVASEFNASVQLMDKPPPGFTTCFRVTFSS